MTVDSHPAADTDLPSGESTPIQQNASPPDRHKIRLRFEKGLDLRLLSHHDLMRTLERMFRRAELPVRQSQGFHPKPRLVFALSLPLGVIGKEEVAEIELDRYIPLEAIGNRLEKHAPPGFRILSLDWVVPSRTAQVRRLTYRLTLSEEDLSRLAGDPPGTIDDLRTRLEQVMDAPNLWVDRTRPAPRRMDLRPLISSLALEPVGERTPGSEQTTWYLNMELWLTPQGTARPEEVLAVLGLGRLLDEGAILERSRLELHDETTLSTTEKNA
jgi:radical SAM-linked protein